MKTTITLLLATALTVGTYAQDNKNKNVKKTTTVTKTAVMDDDGIEVSEKEAELKVTRKLGLTDFKGTHNFEVDLMPRNIETDVSYSYEDEIFAFEKTATGYKMVTVDPDESRSDFADIVKSSQEGFYYVRPKNATNSIGYYDSNGNFIVETYNNDNDTVTMSKFSLKKGKKVSTKKM
ncbi:MAG: hypothetical protein CMC08_04860 [Flavobacteriaceae bacterium]|nr:hypothetical protein [Flavobacteriaceae bacterium]